MSVIAFFMIVLCIIAAIVIGVVLLLGASTVSVKTNKQLRRKSAQLNIAVAALERIKADAGAPILEAQIALDDIAAQRPKEIES